MSWLAEATSAGSTIGPAQEVPVGIDGTLTAPLHHFVPEVRFAHPRTGKYDVSTMQTETPTTWEDVLRMPDDGNRYEFIGGRLYVTPAPVTRHQRISKRLQAALMRVLEDAGHGEVFGAPFLVEFPGTGDRVQPDLLFVSDERREIIGEWQVLGAPDLVVEILSPSIAHRDRGIKLDLYARCGVRQYWIVDPVEDAVDVWRFGDEPGHERFSGELPVRLGTAQVGQVDLDQVFSRHLDLWGTRDE